VPLTCNGPKLLQDRAGPFSGIPKSNFCLSLKLSQDMGAAGQGPNSGHHHPGKKEGYSVSLGNSARKHVRKVGRLSTETGSG
jgi:hypothetical protein